MNSVVEAEEWPQHLKLVPSRKASKIWPLLNSPRTKYGGFYNYNDIL